ncbi:DDE Tnp4 domain-containing protein [Mycena indigotica]|uniref:DDE Tnp4 domain-containing protein n=1 Tax=Mycena indigotica TaxID=2126181 RepID=A0A8H6T9D7_9AGAR|nr:DDE Tnp4 domain-containing protein [Mycena indigotica]KAF7312742.1 DDE Tnp4 domain-containing protein [Mycena indigotica]
MPTLPIRQHLLHSAATYADHLGAQRCEHLAIVADVNDPMPPLLEGDSEDEADDEGEEMSSVSSVSSMEVDGSGSESANPSTDKEEQIEHQYTSQYAALREHVNLLTSTCVLFPHTVSKRSQLDLVLRLFKNDNPPCFRHNLRVLLDTFDCLLAKIDSHSIFHGGNNPQLPAEH